MHLCLNKYGPAAAVVITFLMCASTAAVSEVTLQEIIVVAEKRDESLQDVSQAITALSGSELDKKNISSFVGLSAIAPGLTVAKNEGYKTVISIRGVGNETNQNAIAAPSVAFHMDGIFVASPFSLQTDFMDVERIEVLRGPQGTLFGQNSTGGAINVITKAPSVDGFSGKADLTLGSDYDYTKLRATFNIPVSDSVATRFAMSSTKHDGFTKNVFNGQDLDDADQLSIRSDWFFDLGGADTLRIFGQYFEAESNGAAIKGFYDTTPGERQLSQNTLSAYELESTIFGAIAEFDLGVGVLKVLASSQSDDIYVIRDNDRHNQFGSDNLIDNFASVNGPFYPAFEFNPETSAVDTTTFEVNLISTEPVGGKLDWIVGAFFMDHEIENHIREFLDDNYNGKYDGTFSDRFFNTRYPNTSPATMLEDGITAPQIPNEWGFMSDAYPTRESYSVYAQTTYNSSDTFRLITGLRYTDDSVEACNQNFFADACDNISSTSTETTGKIAAEVDVSANTMVYASFTKGFKPGGSNLTYGFTEAEDASSGFAIVPPMVFPAFDSESITSLEFGLKTEVFDGRLRANAAAFFYNYENLQFQATDPDVFRGGVANIPEAEMSGLELELAGLLTDSLTLDMRLSFLDSEVTSQYEALDNATANSTLPGSAFADGSASCLTGAADSPIPFVANVQAAQGYLGFCYEDYRYNTRQDIDGNQLAKSPEFTADISLRFEKPLESGHLFRGSLSFLHRGDFQQRVINNSGLDTIDSYEILNLTASIDMANSGLSFDLMIMNATDEHGVNSSMTDVFGVNATGLELIPPRQILGRVGYDF